MGKLAETLRDEISEIQKRRHEFAMRKFAFATGLLGLGSLSIKIEQQIFLLFSGIIYLVPFIAIAIDCYILAEDYRDKRIGQFLRLPDSGAENEMRAWENFVHKTPNYLTTYAFSIVTFVLIIGSAIVLWPIKTNNFIYYLWIIITVLVEIILIIIGSTLRNTLENKFLVAKGTQQKNATDS